MKKSLLLLVVAIFTLTTAFDASAKWTDRNTFGLKGPVKAVYDKNYTISNLYFEEDGTYIPIEDEFVSQGVFRDDLCRIIGIGYEYADGHYFDYNPSGQVYKMSRIAGTSFNNIYKYFYDNRGLIIKQILIEIYQHIGGSSDEYKTITTYTYQKFDKYGNWTKRTAKTGRKSRVETRTITYYE